MRRMGLIDILGDDFTCNNNSLLKKLWTLCNWLFHLPVGHTCILNFHSSKKRVLGYFVKKWLGWCGFFSCCFFSCCCCWWWWWWLLVCVCAFMCVVTGGGFKRGQETDYTIVAQTSLDLGIFLPKLPRQIPGVAHHTRLSLWLLKHHPACNIFTWTVSPFC